MSKSPIVMVHGSWHWGGCFQKVADMLGGMGFAVATPDLTSHGYSDATWDSVGSMQEYTAPVKAILELASEPVVLLGHSMGGVALTHLAETIPEKLKCLVYLTAFMTPVGKTANDYIFSYATNPVASSLFKILKPVNEWAGLELDTTDPSLIRDAFYGDCSDTDFKIATKNAVLINTSIPNVYAPGAISSVNRHYITCANDHAIPLDVQMKMNEEVPGATLHSIAASHSPFFSKPKELANLLAAIASE